ncbi:MAG: sulfotransferase [Symploca sp. SIO2B6]|nr:sulfotransferase [Symploca sp. SIO2B6]
MIRINELEYLDLRIAELKKSERNLKTTLANNPFSPNFLIIGAAKAGTTALYHYLAQHPDIYMSPIKELNFFAFEGEKYHSDGLADEGGIKRYEHLQRISVTDPEAYQLQFKGVTNERAIGEASPMYLYNPRTPQRIHDYKSDMRLIVILRNPVDRAHSHFAQYVFKGQERLTDFSQAIKAEDIYVPNIWWGYRHYVRLGFYYRQLQQYFNLFSPNLIKIYLFEDLKASPNRVLQDIFNFIEVDSNLVADTSTKHNQSLVAKNKTVHHSLRNLETFLRSQNPANKLLRQLLPNRLKKLGSDWRVNLEQKNLVKGKPPLSMDVRQQLTSIYRDDILKLQDLIGRDLSNWLKCNKPVDE